MPKTIIESFPTEKRTSYDSENCLHVSECFSRTIQGEGTFTGTPSTFLRVQGCTLSCLWCDTLEVWKTGNPYSIQELVQLFRDNGVIDDLKNGHHLILTGGSPLKQENMLMRFLYSVEADMGFKPFVELENECVLMPSNETAFYVDWWNCSPKLENSGMPKKARYKPEVLQVMSNIHNSSFKFVVTNQDEWDEIVEDFINPFNLNKRKIFLMPEGQTREELQDRYEWLVDLACKENVQVSDRLHVTMWNKKTGV